MKPWSSIPLGINIQHVPELPGTTMYEIEGRLVCSTRTWLQLTGDVAGLIAHDWERLVQWQTSGQ